MKSSLQKILRFLGHFPLIILMLISSYVFYLSYTHFQDTRTMNTLTQNISMLETLASNVSKERELSATYLLNTQSQQKELLLQHYGEANDIMKNFHDFYQSHPISANIQAVVAYLTKLADMRHVVENNSIDFNRMYLSYYSQITLFLHQEIATLMTNAPASSSMQSNLRAYLALLVEQEAYEKERDFMARILMRYLPMEPKEADAWMHFQHDVENVELTLLPQPLRASLESLRKHPDALALDVKINTARASIITTAQSGDFAIEPSAWKALINQKLFLLSKQMDFLHQETVQSMQEAYHQSFAQLISAGATWLLALILSLSGLSPNNAYEERNTPSSQEPNEDAHELNEEETIEHPAHIYEPLPRSQSNDHFSTGEANEYCDILICKQSLIEGKLIHSLLSKSYAKAEYANSYTEFRRKIVQNHYRMVLFDYTILEDDVEAFLTLIHDVEVAHKSGHISTVMCVEPHEEIALFQLPFDKIIYNTLTRKELETLVGSYLQKA